MDTIRILVSHYVCLFVGAIIGYAIALLMSMAKWSFFPPRGATISEAETRIIAGGKDVIRKSIGQANGRDEIVAYCKEVDRKGSV